MTYRWPYHVVKSPYLVLVRHLYIPHYRTSFLTGVGDLFHNFDNPEEPRSKGMSWDEAESIASIPHLIAYIYKAL